LTLRILVGAGIVVVLVRFAYTTMRNYVRGAAEQAGEDPPSTVDVSSQDVRLRCATCGLEVLVTRAGAPDGTLTPTRHCQEEMVMVAEIST
jgi:hypothetical protein